jgi:hypothetical protein
MKKPTAARVAGSRPYTAAVRMKSAPYAFGTMMGKMKQKQITFGAGQTTN